MLSPRFWKPTINSSPNGATVPIGNFDQEILDITIPVNTNEHKGKQLSVHEILLSTSWCSQFEQMETPGLLLVTTHSQINAACTWIDANPNRLTTVAHQIF